MTRIRQQSHVPGIWATHVYIDVPETEELKRIVSSLKAEHGHLEPVEDIHVSLSHTVYLQSHQTDAFSADLIASLKGVKRFLIGLDRLAIYTNESESTSFLSLDASNENQEILKPILQKVDAVMTSYGKPTFFKEPRFHASILWSTSSNLREIVSLEPFTFDPIDINVSKLHLRMGNRFVPINFD